MGHLEVQAVVKKEIEKRREARLKCCIMFCNRTTPAARGFDEWICSIHYKFVPARLKSLKRKAQRRALKSPTKKNIQRFVRIWEKCKEHATMRGL